MIQRLLAVAALVLGLSACATTAQISACAPEQGLHFVCGTGAMEDVAAIPGTPWLIGSNLNVGSPARLRLIDRAAMQVSDLATDFTSPPQPVGQCPGPPDPSRWSVSGLALDGARLLAINHGDRMAVELFTLDLTGARPKLQWQGCAPMPSGTLPNALTPDGSGGFYVVSFHNPADPQPWAHMAQGEPTGSVWHWREGRGFTQLPAGPLVGGNGIALSPDGQSLWISAWGAGQLVQLDLASGARRVVPLGFLPDNLHFAANGALLVAGQRADVAAIGACGPRCPQGWVVAQVAPVSGTVTSLLEGTGSAAIDYAAGVREVDGQLWLTLRSDGRIGRLVPQP